MISIGLDPSLTGFGWSVFQGNALVSCGVWRTERAAVEGKVADDNHLRFDFIATSLFELIASEIARGEQVQLFVEQLALVFGRCPSGIAAAQGRARGLVDGIAASLTLPVIEVPSAKVKRLANVGKIRKVSKEEVRDAVFAIYPLAREILPSGKVGLNASDSIAIGHVGMAMLRDKDRLQAGDGSGW